MTNVIKIYPSLTSDVIFLSLKISWITLQHALKAVFPLGLKTNDLRRFHRPPLKRLSYGPLLSTKKFHPIKSLRSFIREKERERALVTVNVFCTNFQLSIRNLKTSLFIAFLIRVAICLFKRRNQPYLVFFETVFRK